MTVQKYIGLMPTGHLCDIRPISKKCRTLTWVNIEESLGRTKDRWAGKMVQTLESRCVLAPWKGESLTVSALGPNHQTHMYTYKRKTKTY